MGGTKLERFLPKNQHTQRKLFNFENWISGGLRSVIISYLFFKSRVTKKSQELNRKLK